MVTPGTAHTLALTSQVSMRILWAGDNVEHTGVTIGHFGPLRGIKFREGGWAKCLCVHQIRKWSRAIRRLPKE